MLAFACLPAAGQKWVTTWAASVQGPYPVGNPSVQPNLRFAFPSPETGARDQTFRLIVHPDLWGTETRLRFSNVFGTKPLTLDGIFAGAHLGAAAVVAGTNRAVRFAGKAAVTIAQANRFGPTESRLPPPLRARNSPSAFTWWARAAR